MVAKVFSKALLEAMRPDGVPLGAMGFPELMSMASPRNKFGTNLGLGPGSCFEVRLRCDIVKDTAWQHVREYLLYALDDEIGAPLWKGVVVRVEVR